MLNQNSYAKSGSKAGLPLAMIAAGALLVSACTKTEKMQINESSLHCGLLGDVCGQLRPGSKDQMALRYFKPSVQWTSYSKIMIDPVTFWGGPSTTVPASDQQMLTNYTSQQLKKHVGEKLQIVDQPGPGVLKLSVAMTDAETATPVLRSISMIVPQAHILSNLKYLATGTFPFVGGAQMEAKITDSMSGELLGAVADKRIGGGSPEAGFQWQWGDAENAIDHWCDLAAERLSSWVTGESTP